MTQYKLIALVAPSLFNNLISSTDMEIILDMVQIVEFYTSPSLSEQHIQDMKSSISGFFSKIINRFPTEHGTTSTYKIANLHYITEYIVRDVEIFGHRLENVSQKSTLIKRFCNILAIHSINFFDHRLSKICFSSLDRM